MKHEWRKKEKYYYLPKTNPEIVNIQELKFIQIKGCGIQIVRNFLKR